jgi:hypothetical protein
MARFAAAAMAAALAMILGVAPSRAQNQLNFQSTGGGTVIATNQGNSAYCGPIAENCGFGVPAGAVMNLTESPIPGFSFIGWEGACTGNGPCVITVAANGQPFVSGSFAPGSAPGSPLVFTISPAAQSVQVGLTASFQASLNNVSSDTALSCAIAPVGALPATFSYEADLYQIGAIGVGITVSYPLIPNAPFDIPPGADATVTILFTPTAPFATSISRFTLPVPICPQRRLFQGSTRSYYRRPQHPCQI